MSGRRIAWLVCGVLVAAATAGAVVAVRHFSIPAVPVLQCESAIDLGERFSSDQVLARFRVSNGGRAELALSSFGTSCTCAGVVAESSGEWKRVEGVTVPAGGSVELAVRISVIAAAGTPQQVQVTFKTTDPANPSHRLVFTIPRVKGNLYCDPAAVVFGTVSPDSPQSQIVRVYENGGGARKVDSITSTVAERFTVRQRPTPADAPVHEIGGRLVAEVELTPVAGYTGPLNSMVEIVVSGERGERKHIPVSGEVPAEYLISPSAVVLPRVANGKTVWQAELTVARRDEGAFRLELAEGPAGVSVRVEPAGEATAFTVRVERPKPVEESPVQQTTLKLTTRQTGQPARSFDVPVIAPR